MWVLITCLMLLGGRYLGDSDMEMLGWALMTILLIPEYMQEFFPPRPSKKP